MTISKTVVASSLLFGMMIGVAHAENCYQLKPFIDTVRNARVGIGDEAVEGPHRLLIGNWTAANIYSLPIVGSYDVTVPRTTPPTYRFSVHGVNHTTAFAGHNDCTLDAVINGAWTVSCDGNNANAIFNGSGTPFAEISCDTLSTSFPQGGRALGQ